MSTKAQPQQHSSIAPPAWTPARSGLLQRKCACGGTPGPDGECAACRAKQEAAQNRSPHEDSAIGHAFSRVQIGTRTSETFQPKLVVGQPNDHYEQEADRIANAVMRAPEQGPDRDAAGVTSAPHFQIRRKCVACGGSSTGTHDDEETLRAKELPAQTPQVTPELHTRIRHAVTGGQPLPTPVRSFYETRLGYDFSHVRIHTDDRAAATARDVHARAFTLGRDIVFGTGQYAPTTTGGQHLLAHELAHVLQQGGAPSPGSSVPPTQTTGVIQRAIDPELDRIESYLSYGIFDWAITDADATKALDLLKQLSRHQQALFFTNKKYIDRLRDNLPKDRIAELNAIESGLGEIRPATATVEDIRDKLSTGLFDWAVTDKDAVTALDKLKQLPASQLAVALGSIDYSRLLDNLPEDRKQELIDLLARGLGTGGGRETEERANPGVALNNLTFTSDHGALKSNKTDWNNSGDLFGQPEWFVGDKKTVSHPISQTKDSSVDVDLSLNVLPLAAPSAPITITGDSDVDALKFSFSSTMHGGMAQKVSLSSAAKLPNAVTAIRDKMIIWKMKWRDWEHEIARTGPHTIFTTIGAPARPEQVTYRRMEKAVEIAEDAGTMVPHNLVKNIAFIWGKYNLDVQYGNEWELAENPDVGAQCIDLVRFVQSVIGMIGCPGLAEAVIVWADPSAPDVGLEALWGSGGGMSSVGPHPLHPTWGAALLDGDNRPNNFEAALKFTESGMTKYYPGGVRLVLSSPDEVLRVFTCLVWLTWEGNKRCRVQEVLASYMSGCPTGVFQCTP